MRARDNPYRSERVTSLTLRLVGCDWAELLQRWETLGRRGALVAPHGHGKSTLLHAFEQQLRTRGSIPHRINLSQDRPRLPVGWSRWLASLGTRDVILLDGAEQLSWLQWWRFARGTSHLGGLLITTHRPGRLPTLYRCTTSPELLRELVCELGGEGALSPAEAERLFACHAGNLREALFALYAEASKQKPAVHARKQDRRCRDSSEAVVS